MQNKTQAEIARQEIERMIVFGELNINILYSENKLAAMLNLGRTPVREALQSLEQGQMLTIHPRKGVEFLTITPEQQIQLLEIRRQIEPICLHFAMMRATIPQKKSMLELGEKIIKSTLEQDQRSILYCLQDIHSLLCEATQNPYFSHALNQIQFFSRRFWFANKEKSDELRAGKMHKLILRAVACGNEKNARFYSNMLMEHLTESTFRKI